MHPLCLQKVWEWLTYSPVTLHTTKTQGTTQCADSFIAFFRNEPEKICLQDTATDHVVVFRKSEEMSKNIASVKTGFCEYSRVRNFRTEQLSFGHYNNLGLPNYTGGLLTCRSRFFTGHFKGQPLLELSWKDRKSLKYFLVSGLFVQGSML
jgi:hypothetical protein